MLCDKLKKLSKDFYRPLDAIEATVLLVIVKWMTNRKQGSAVLLQTTLADAKPYHFVPGVRG
jgi:hypothetical protein